jgi:hypothetical protein
MRRLAMLVGGPLAEVKCPLSPDDDKGSYRSGDQTYGRNITRQSPQCCEMVFCVRARYGSQPMMATNQNN